MKERAVVTYARSLFSLAVIRSLGERGIAVAAGDELQLTPGALSRYATSRFTYPNVHEDPEGYLHALESVVSESAAAAPTVFLPMQRDTRLVARHRDRFERHAALALADAETIERLDDKRRLVREATAAGVRTPETWLVDNLADLEARIHEIELPAFVKRPDGSGGAGIARVETLDDLRERYAEIAQRAGPGTSPFVQALAPGSDFCFSALYDRGRRIASMSYECLATYPRNKGPGAIRRTVDAPELEEAGNRLLRHVGWHGVIELDFRWQGQGHDPLLIEANARFFGGTFLGVHAGVDYPWLTYQVARGEKLEPMPPAPGGRVTRTPILSFLATLEDFVSGDIAQSTIETMIQHARDSVRQGSRVKDILRILGRDLNQGLHARHDRLATVRQVLQTHEGSVLEVLDRDDPGPVLGLLYPLALFIEHGELTPELLVGAGRK